MNWYAKKTAEDNSILLETNLFGRTKPKENSIIRLDLDDVAIQIASDLHLEFYGALDAMPSDILERRAPTLALLGDIGLACTELLRSFLLEQSDRFEHVFFVAGNHEFYNNHPNKKMYTVQEQMEWMRQVCQERDNLHFLERQVVEIQGVRILGTSLLSFVPPEATREAEQSMNDYHLSYIVDSNGRPQPMTTTFNAWFKESSLWLERQIHQAKQENRPVLVLTHHTPSLQGTSHPQYEGSTLSCCFSSDLSHLLSDPVKFWACGHTHYNFDQLVGETRLVSNQRGYPRAEKEDFDAEGIVLRVITPPVASKDKDQSKKM